MLTTDKGLMSAKDIKSAFSKAKMTLDGVSAHCPIWVQTTAWTGSPTIRPFIPADVAKKSVADIEKWAEEYVLRLFDLCAELGVKIIPMFWGVAFGWELATGYPWGFWKGGDYDLLIHSIRTQILSLPDETRLLCGHGPETMVGEERKSNPFL